MFILILSDCLALPTLLNRANQECLKNQINKNLLIKSEIGIN